MLNIDNNFYNIFYNSIKLINVVQIMFILFCLLSLLKTFWLVSIGALRDIILKKIFTYFIINNIFILIFIKYMFL